MALSIGAARMPADQSDACLVSQSVSQSIRKYVQLSALFGNNVSATRRRRRRRLVTDGPTVGLVAVAPSGAGTSGAGDSRERAEMMRLIIHITGRIRVVCRRRVEMVKPKRICGA